MSGSEDEKKKPIVVRNSTDLQRLKLEKLMKNPDKPILIPERPKERGIPVVPDFVRNVMGSSAGAGSGEFHVYRHLRRKEYARQKYMKEKGEREKLEQDYHDKLDDNKRKADEKTAKKRAKRLKKKKNQKKKKPNTNSAKSSSSEDDESSSDDDSSNEKSDDCSKDDPRSSEDNSRNSENDGNSVTVSSNDTETVVNLNEPISEEKEELPKPANDLDCEEIVDKK